MRIAPQERTCALMKTRSAKGRNFANKLYNATRFRLMQGDARGETAPLLIRTYLHYLPSSSNCMQM